MRPLAAILALALALAPALHAQRAGDVPRRPRLEAGADSNDARAYYRLGRDLLVARRARDAAEAFYWASGIEPGWADPLYARHVALLMSDPHRLVLYLAGDPRTRTAPEVLAIDSLYFRALRIDPFVQRPLERDLVRLSLRRVLTRYEGYRETEAERAVEWMLRDMPPLLRGRVLAGEGRLAQALQAYDEALRERGGRRSETRRHIRHERGRMFALAGNDSAALAELQLAIDAGVEEETALEAFYDSKAVLQHSRGAVFERLGDRAAAREAYTAALLEDLGYYPAHVRLGLLAVMDGDTAAALAEMDLAVQTAGAEPTVLHTYGTMLAQLGRPDEAVRHLARATELAPFYADPWFALGVVRDGEGSLAAARQAYRAFLDRAARSHRHRSAAEKRLRDLDAAAAPAQADPPAAGSPPPDAAARPTSFVRRESGPRPPFNPCAESGSPCAASS